MKLSPTERLVAFVTGRSTVHVAEISLKGKERLLLKVTDHKGIFYIISLISENFSVWILAFMR